MHSTDELLAVAETKRQRAIVKSLAKTKSRRETANQLGLTPGMITNALRTLSKRIERASGCSGESNKRIKALEKIIDQQAESIERLRGSKFRLPTGKKTKSGRGAFCRIVIPDTHGCVVDTDAIACVFGDIETIKPREIVMLGDHLECGGFLAQHHTLGYVAQTEYTFEEDVAACNQLLDRLQLLCPEASIDYLEGNHERRLENWCTTQSLRNKQDSAYLMRMFSAESVLSLNERGINWVRQGVFYDGVAVPATIKRGHVYFTHGCFTGQHAASQHVKRFGGNVVYGHCFSEDTELLTENGWKLFSDISVGEMAMTMNLDNGASEWQPIKDVFSHSQYKELLHFNYPAIDAMVTPDHAMVTTSRGAVTIRDSLATRTLRRRTAKDLVEASAFTIPCGGVNRQDDYPICDDVLRLYAWIITEGNVSTNRGYGGHIRIAQSDNPDKGGLEAILGVLSRLGISYSCNKRYEAGSTEHGQHRNYDAYRINIARAEPICDEFARDCPGKSLQPWMLKLSHRQFEILFDTLITADGCKNKSAKNSYQYATNRTDEKDIFQSLCAINGYRCSVIPRDRNGAKYFCITVNSRGVQHCTDTKPVLVPYEGLVWCASVDNQSLMVRRNGKSFVAGNTHRADSYVIRTVKEGSIGGWSPGCLCKLQPLWMHTNPTEWSHGYGLQLVNEDGSFLHINVPIINGKSYLEPLVKAIA